MPQVLVPVAVGWWPMVAWGVRMRVDFLGKTVGREIRWIEGDEMAWRADPKAHYHKYFEGEVKKSIAAGQLVLAEQDMCFVVAGYDEQEPPLLGDCPLEEKHKAARIKRYPWGLIVLGDEIRPLDRQQADLEALRHGVALAKDATGIRVPEWASETGWFTGQKSFALWAAALRDIEHLGQARWHSNMVMHLGINRRGAVAYLGAMAKRHPEPVAAHLRAAADLYEQVLAELKTADTSEAAMMSREGREKLAALAESIAAIEARATGEIERAFAAANAQR